MSEKIVANVIPGFSLTNRWLIYTSLMLTPAQAVSGIGSNCPSNIGFLAYNWWQQYLWFSATKSKQLHALSLLPDYLNMMYGITYLGGIQSGNLPMGALLGLGSVGLLAMNTVTAWLSLRTNLPEGDGVYQFFFFGWRTLSKGWRILFLLWEISNTIEAAFIVVWIFAISIGKAEGWDEEDMKTSEWKLLKATAVLWGSVFMMIFIWPFILWMELIVNRNHIVSETDMVSVYLFIAQVGTMLLPNLLSLFSLGSSE